MTKPRAADIRLTETGRANFRHRPNSEKKTPKIGLGREDGPAAVRGRAWAMMSNAPVKRRRPRALRPAALAACWRVLACLPSRALDRP